MIKKIGTSFFSFLILDFIWLGFVVRDFNLRLLADIGRIKNDQFDLLYVPAFFAYLLMALSVVFFVMPIWKDADPLWKTFLRGAFMGLIVFGVYDMTNLATLKNYPLLFVFSDISWGCVTYGIVTCITQMTCRGSKLPDHR